MTNEMDNVIHSETLSNFTVSEFIPVTLNLNIYVRFSTNIAITKESEWVKC